LCGSKTTSAHPLLQATSPILQPAQAPLRHCPVPALQLFPHVPQWAGSEDVSTQEPPHAVWPGWHGMHTPAMHNPDPHGVPHAPQLAGSDEMSTHWPPHAVWPSAQPLHVPATHKPVPPLHTVAQAPQLPGSDATFTHLPPQLTSPPEQTQLPLTQVPPVGHVCPQVPQLLVSDPRLTQPVGHCTRPDGHEAVTASIDGADDCNTSGLTGGMLPARLSNRKGARSSAAQAIPARSSPASASNALRAATMSLPSLEPTRQKNDHLRPSFYADVRWQASAQ
jgi:hypothetical protein